MAGEEPLRVDLETNRQSIAVITGVLSMPLTFFLTNDAFYFGILPILTEAAGHYGIAPVEMARASIIGQPVHMTSPLVPAPAHRVEPLWADRAQRGSAVSAHFLWPAHPAQQL